MLNKNLKILITLPSKFRAQSEQHSLVDGQLSRLQSVVSLGLEQINERVTIMENKFRSFSSNQDEAVDNLQKIQEKVTELHKIRVSSRNPRQHPVRINDEASQRNKTGSVVHSSHHICNEMKGTLRSIDTKLDHVYKKINGVRPNETLITMHEDNVLTEGHDYFIDPMDHELEAILFDKPDGISHPQSSSSSKKQFFKLLRRITLPFKKANKRLREMEDIRHRFTTSLDQMRGRSRIILELYSSV